MKVTDCPAESFSFAESLAVGHGDVAAVAANAHWLNSADPTPWRSSPVCTLASW